MLTCDDDFADRAKGFIKKAVDDDKPFFVWVNFTHMHLFTHTKKESLGQAGRWQSPYHDTMIDHDKNVGSLLDYLDELGIADDTFVMYSTDNGPHRNSWPDGGMTPFRSEKNTNWEGAFRIPLVVRYPGKIKAGLDLERDRPASRLAADLPGTGRQQDRRRRPEEGRQGASAAPTRTTSTAVSLLGLPDRQDGQVAAQGVRLHLATMATRWALRYDNWKVVFMEQRCKGTMAGLGRAVHAAARAQALQSSDRPYEFADITSNTYYDWFLHHDYIVYGGDRVADEVQRDVRRISEDPEAEYVHRRSSDRQAACDGRGS